MPSTGSVYANPVKKCFEAKEGKIFYHVDYSALEDRVIANLSKDINKCSIFIDGLDGHCLNSYYYFKEKIEAELPRKEDETLKEYIKRYKQAVDDGNKVLKALRQKSKGCTFGCSYGAYPPKIAKSIGCTLEEAQQIFDRYHKELYPQIDEMRQTIADISHKNKRVHLGFGYYLNTENPDKDARTLFNACSQFWSILTLLTINKLNSLIEREGFLDRIVVCSTIYDSIYIHLDCDPTLIKWLNDTIIPLLIKPFLTEMEVQNKAVGELSFNWCDGIEISNNASLDEISEAIEKAKALL